MLKTFCLANLLASPGGCVCLCKEAAPYLRGTFTITKIYRRRSQPSPTYVSLIRKKSLDERVIIDHDPLATDPDYLAVGPESKFGTSTIPTLKTGAFHLLRASQNQIYGRVR